MSRSPHFDPTDTRSVKRTLTERVAPFDLDLEAARNIDRACEAFEKAWRDGDEPELESWLIRFEGSPDAKAQLLFELLALELELRRERGEQPLTLGYLDRFPEEAGAISRAFSTAVPRGSFDEGAAPRRFGDYELLDELARGGMGVVYRARQISLNRTVALKMILSGQFATEAELRRFHIEAEAAAHLDHPNIVPILEVGRHQGHAFFSMKLIGNGSLSQHLARFLGAYASGARLMATVSQAIHYAHGKGLIHRDLKPSNILIDDSGQPLIADFGLVKRTIEGQSLTTTGAILGTPSYMAPEQVSGGEVTHAADIYSLGAILYQLLTGRPPFRGASPADTLAQVVENHPIPPRLIRPTIPRALESICLKCLEKEPANRYGSALSLAEDLERYLQGEDVHVGRPSLLKGLSRWARREPEFACRLVTQVLVVGLTQLNYLMIPSPDFALHMATMGAEAIWISATLVLRRLAQVERRWELVRTTCTGVDLVMTTALLRILDAVDSSLVVAYMMLIAASGLWNRVRLVWLTTGLAILGYTFLTMDSHFRGLPRDSNHHPDIILTALAVTGLIITQQVRHVRALTSEAGQVP